MNVLKAIKWNLTMAIKFIPFEFILTTILVNIAALFPALQNYSLMKVITIMSDKITIQEDWYWYLALIFSYVLPLLLSFISSISLNYGIYDKFNSKLNVWFHEILAEKTIDDYSTPEFLEKKQQSLNFLNWEISGTIIHQFVQVTANIVTIVSLIVVLIQFHWSLLAICMIGFIPTIFITQKNTQKTYELKEKQTQSTARLKYLWNALTNRQIIKENRLMNMQEKIEDEWFYESEIVLSQNITLESKYNLWTLFSLTMSSVGYLMCIAVSIILIRRDLISPAGIIAGINTFYYFQVHSNQVIKDLGSFTKHLKLSQHIILFSERNDMEEQKLCLKDPINDIVLNNIYYKYPNQSEDALIDVNLRIKPTETIAIVGRNGSGKSTLANVILGLQKPYKGTVLINGYDVNDLNKGLLFEQVGVMPQCVTRFKGKFRDILHFGMDKAYNDEFWLKIFSKLKFDIKESDLELIVGPEFSGLDFSGGEWQKINLARVLAYPYTVTVLDEPTSALDPIIESEVLEGMLDAIQNRTNVIISHRMGLCTKVDRIVVMNEGRIVECGSHEMLMEKKELYYNLFTLQSN